MPVSSAGARRGEATASSVDPLLPPANNGALTVALALSLVFHSVLLLITFKYPDALNFKIAPGPIEVVLVNSKSSSRPVKADAFDDDAVDGQACEDVGGRQRPELAV